MTARVKQPGMTNAEYLCALRKRAVELGRCYGCRKRPLKPGARYCFECIQRSARFGKTLAATRRCTNCCCNLPRGWTTQLCPGCSVLVSERDRAQRAALIEAGLCDQCHAPAAPGHRRCQRCLDDVRDRQLARNRARGMRPRACPACRELGIDGSGHDRRTHGRWLERRKAWSP